MTERPTRNGRLAYRLAMGSFIAIAASAAARANEYQPSAVSESASTPRMVIAQAGTMGGTVAKQNKSVSGDQESTRPRSSPKSERVRPRRTTAARERGPAQATSSYDGSWAGVSVGPCISTWKWNVQISNGVLTGNDTFGQVSRTGSVSGRMKVFGTTYNFSGRGSGGQMGGTWVAPGSCSGTWTAIRS